MKRLIALIATGLIVSLAASPATAQRFSYSEPYRAGPHDAGLVRSPFAQDAWHGHGGHGTDLVGLTNLVGELGLVCQHLHDDALQLSQDYHHSAAIAAYIDRLERLKAHMYDVLQQATACGSYSGSLERHILHDTRDAKSLLIAFYRQLERQSFDGVRDCDFRLISHMKEVMLNEAFPLMTRLEIAVFGDELGGSHRAEFSHRAARPSYGYSELRIETSRSRVPRASARPTVVAPAAPPLPPFAERILRSAPFAGPPNPFSAGPFGGAGPFGAGGPLSGLRISF